MHITHLRTNHLVNPLGYALEQVVLTWVTEDSQSSHQQRARIEVAIEDDFSFLIIDTGWSASLSSLGHPLDIELMPRTRYYWRVSVENNLGVRTTSETAWFETAKLNEPWQARWITTDDASLTAPLFSTRLSFSGQQIERVRAYISGVGLYELSVNGQKVGDEYLSPGCTAYDSWLQYQTWDLTEQFIHGQNQLEVILGNGWYKGRFGFNHGGKENHYGDRFELICEIVVTLADGSEQVFVTDEGWQCSASQIGDNNIYDGEHIDATRTYAFSPAVLSEQTLMPRLQARKGLPVIIHERLRPVQVIDADDGSVILDFGQNIVGWVAFDSSGIVGETVTLHYAEILQDEAIYTANLRTASATFSHVSDDQIRHVRPHFTFYGFRYVSVTGLNSRAALETFHACFVYSAIQPLSQLTTASPRVNQFIDNVMRSHKGNFVDIPTDCPQRDERMGWTGDLQVFSSPACMNMDVYAFLSKYLYDVALEQEKMGGAVPFVVPMFDVKEAGSCAWGDAATVVPWNMWLHYGDKTILSRQYASMKSWVDYIRGQVARQPDTQKLWNSGFHFGDWLALDNEPHIKTFKGRTEDKFIASIYYHYSAQIVGKAAAVLGYESDAQLYSRLADEILDELRNEYLTQRGKLALETQTAYILAILFDIYPAHFFARAAADLTARLARDRFKITSGFVGTPFFCRALTKVGLNDIAYRMFLSEEKPGWMYPVTQGATTVWERWDSVDEHGVMHPDTSMNSLNHYAFGSVIDWLYKDVCGLKPVESCPGFKRAHIEPQPNYRLGSVALTTQTAAGEYQVSWAISADGVLMVSVTVPFDCSARLTLPDIDKLAKMRIQGDVQAGVEQHDRVIVDLTAGRYRFEYTPIVDYIPRYNIAMPIRELLSNDETRQILQKHIPDVLALPFLGLLENESLQEIAKKPFFHYPAPVLRGISDEIARHTVA